MSGARTASAVAPGNSVRRSDAPSRQDATLASLSVSDTLSQTADGNGIPATVVVAAATSRVTVTAVTAHSEASYTISVDDADADADGHQVDLLEPVPDADPDLDGHQVDLPKPQPGSGTPTRTTATITVTNTDNTTGAYQVTIERAPHRGTGFVDIDVGWGHACALGADGQIACWGNINNNSPRPARSPSTPDLVSENLAWEFMLCDGA